MDQFDKNLKQALEHSVEHVTFSRQEAVARAVQAQDSAMKTNRFFLFFKPALAYAAAFAVITTVALGSLLWVPGTPPDHQQEVVVAAGEIPFAAVQHMLKK